MFSQFRAGRPSMRLHKEPRAKYKLSLVLEKIKAEHPEFDQEEFKTYRESLEGLLQDEKESADATSVDDKRRFVRYFQDVFEKFFVAPHADFYETQFHLIEEILDYVKESDPENYIRALSLVITAVKDCCIVGGGDDFLPFNKFLPFAESLLRQAKNVDSNNEEEYTQYLAHLILLDKEFTQFSTKYKQPYYKQKVDSDKVTAETVGGEESFYEKCKRWPLHVQIENARQGFERFDNFFVNIIRSIGYDLSEMTAETAINYFIINCNLTLEDYEYMNSLKQRWNMVWGNQVLYEQALPGLLHNPDSVHKMPELPQPLAMLVVDYIAPSSDETKLSEKARARVEALKAVPASSAAGPVIADVKTSASAAPAAGLYRR